MEVTGLRPLIVSDYAEISVDRIKCFGSVGYCVNCSVCGGQTVVPPATKQRAIDQALSHKSRHNHSRFVINP